MDGVELQRTTSETLLPSRRAALETCRAALLRGPVVLTGEAGVGKSWLARRFDGPDRWIDLDIAPDTAPSDLLRELLLSLGADPARRADLRWSLAAALEESAADGLTIGLRLDEVHVASELVLEEVRRLTNRLGAPGGFATVVLVGQTPFLAKLRRRGLDGLRNRIAEGVHLAPLSWSESRAYLTGLGATSILNDAALERLHRDCRGNPRSLRLHVAGLNAARAVPPLKDSTGPLLGESRPPLVVEDGLIEVGWDDEPAVGADEPFEGEPRSASGAEAIALADDAAPPLDDPAHDRPAGGEAPPFHDRPAVRVETGQEFAPYSQLFSRRQRAKDADKP